MADKRRMYYVGFCRICGTGPLGLRECGGCGAVVVLCDECDAVWVSADFSVKPRFADEGALPCPHCDASLIETPSRWATKKTIQATPWLRQALAKKEMKLHRGSALTPEVEEE